MNTQKTRIHPAWRTLICLFSMLLLLNFTSSLDAQFKEESARAAYELRMQGEILYAAAMLDKLAQQNKTEGGLVMYEMARVREHQSLGGAEWASPMIIGQAQWAVSQDPLNLLFNYYDAQARFGKAYMSMMTDGETAGEDIRDAVEKLEKVLEMDPDFHEVRVQLTEIYSQLPEDLAGDPEKAEFNASYLENKDPYFGMLARAVMLSDSLSRVDFWNEKMENAGEDTRIGVKLGKAYLLDGRVEEALPLFEKAMKADPANNILLLHIARYHMYQAMWDQSKAEEAIPLAEEAIGQYLVSEPEALAPYRAWALGKLAMFNRFEGNQEEFERLNKKASELDPAFSKATGLPGQDLYTPPGELYRSGDYESFLRPF